MWSCFNSSTTTPTPHAKCPLEILFRLPENFGNKESIISFPTRPGSQNLAAFSITCDSKETNLSGFLCWREVSRCHLNLAHNGIRFP